MGTRVASWFPSGLSPFITGSQTSSVADPFYIKPKFYYYRAFEDNEKVGIMQNQIFFTKVVSICNIILLVESISIVKMLWVVVMFPQEKC